MQGGPRGSAGAAGALLSQTSSDGSPLEKRRKLRHYDLLPGQILNAMGTSGIESVDLGRLYQTMSRGNKVCAAYSELCFPEPERRGVGLSRLSEVMMGAIDRLRGCQPLRDILKEDALALIHAEAERLYPHFAALNRGNSTAARDGGTIRSIAYSTGRQDRDSDPEAAAEAVHAWLSLPSSPLRSALALFSAGGLFYVAQCHEKGARAVVHKVPMDSAQFEAAAIARGRRAQDLSADELGGLTQPDLDQRDL